MAFKKVILNQFIKAIKMKKFNNISNLLINYKIQFLNYSRN